MTMQATQCPAIDELKRLATGVISDEAAEPIERHLLECPTCVERVAGFQTNDTLFNALHAQSTVKEDPTELSDEFRRLVSRLGELSPPTLSSQLDATSGTWPEGNAADASVAPVSYGFLAAAEAPDEIGRLGGYRVLGVLGAGGMGVVFEAEDPRLKRRVALKVMKPELAAHPQSRQRFLREAQAMAALDHDHVVTIHQVAEDGGVPFFAMQFLQGESLADRLANAEVKRQKAEKEGNTKPSDEPGRPEPSSLPEGNGTRVPRGALSLDEVLRIGREVADGLAAAHARGLIHRDIKPGNIWLETGRGRPRAKILDFGLARTTEGTENLTQSAAILGTPSYMAPEQARGETVDGRADLFSLGCVLYRMATGEAPFKGTNPLGVLMSLAVTTPPAPRELNADVPEALNDLLVRLLSKDPADRPQSAREVAEKLEEIPFSEAKQAGPENGAPRTATPKSKIENLKSRRPPRLRFRLLCTAAVVVLGVVIVIKDREGRTVATVKTSGPAEVEAADGVKVAVRPGDELDKAEGQRQKAEDKLDGKPNKLDHRHPSPLPEGEGKSGNGFPYSEALSSMALVTKPTAIDGVKRWTIETRGHRGRIYQAEYSPDGKWLATIGSDGTIRLWDSASGKLVRALVGHGQVEGTLAWSPDSASLAEVDTDAIRFWEIASGRVAKTLPINTADRVYKATWSPDGKKLAIGLRRNAVGQHAESLELFDVAGSELLESHPAQWREPEQFNAAMPPQILCWSPDSQRLVFYEQGGNKMILDVESGQLAPTMAMGSTTAWRADGALLTPLCDPNGERKTIELWRSDNGQLLHTLTIRDPRPLNLETLRLSADGSVLFAATVPDAPYDDGEHPVGVFLWDTASGELIWTCEVPAPHEHYIQYTAGPLGQHIASFGPFAGSLRIVRPESDQPPRGEPALVSAGYWNTWQSVLAWSPDGTTLAKRGEDLLVGFWDLASVRRIALSTETAQVIAQLAWSADGDRLRACYQDGATLYDPASGQSLCTATLVASRFKSLSPNGERVALAWPEKVECHSLDSGRLLCTLPAANTFMPAWSADGKRLATFADKTTIWDIPGGNELSKIDVAAPAEWAPDGKRLAFVFGNGERFEVRDAASGETLVEWELDGPGRPSSGGRMAWSPDGTRIAGFGRVFNAASGNVVCHLSRFDGNGGQPTWSPDSNLIAYGSVDRATVIADAATGRALTTLLSFTRGRTLAVSPHGHFHASPRTADELIYIVETDAGQDVLSPAEFAEKFGWQNDPAKVGLGAASGTRERAGNLAILSTSDIDNDEKSVLRGQSKPSEIQGPPARSRVPLAKLKSKPLSPLALVQDPAALPGVESWSLEPVEPVGGFSMNYLNSLAVSPDGKYLAVGGDDGHVRIFDWATGSKPRLAQLLAGHSSAVIGVAWSADGEWIASAEGGAPMVRIWNVESANTRVSAAIGLNDITCLAWSPDGALLAVNGDVGPRLINTQTGELLPLLERRVGTSESLAWSPDGKQLAAGTRGYGALQIWDITTGALSHVLTTADHEGGFVAWSPDGKTLANSGGTATHFWDPATGKLRNKLAVPHANAAGFAVAPYWLDSGRAILLGDVSDGRSHGWDVSTGEPAGQVEPGFRRSQSTDAQVTVTDGAWGGPIKLHDAHSKKRRQISVRPLTTAATWSPDGRWLATNVAERVGVWDATTNGRVTVLSVADGMANSPQYLAWLNDGSALIDANGIDTAIYWRTPGGWTARLLNLGPCASLSGPGAALSHDGKYFAYAPVDTDGRPAENGKTIVIYELANSMRVGQLEPHVGPVSYFAWSSDDTRIAGVDILSGPTSTLAIWDAKSGKRLQKVTDLPLAKRLCWSPDGKSLALGCADGVRVFDENLRLRTDLSGHVGNAPVAALGWSADGSEVMTVDGSAMNWWKAEAGELRRRINLGLPGETWLNHHGMSFDTGCWFSPDNRRLAVPTAGLKVLDTETGQLQASFVPLRDGRAIVVTAGGHYLASSKIDDDFVYVVRTADGQELLAPKQFAEKYGWKNDPSKAKLPSGPL